VTICGDLPNFTGVGNEGRQCSKKKLFVCVMSLHEQGKPHEVAHERQPASLPTTLELSH
jgi:hypothetical protein